MKRIPLAIIAVAVICLAATSAFSYYEHWTNLMSSGSLTYDGNTYNHPSPGTGATLCDSTVGTVDSLYIGGDGITALFINSVIGDTIRLDIVEGDVHGAKSTGRSGTPSFSNGDWTGEAYVFSTSTRHTVTGTFGGDFDYTTTPHEWSGDWDITDSDPDGIGGSGDSDGVEYEWSSSSPCQHCD